MNIIHELFKKNHELFMIILQGMIWLAGSGEDFFQYKHMQKWFSPLWPHLTPEDHDLYKLEFPLY
jgi:hypothetical protein